MDQMNVEKIEVNGVKYIREDAIRQAPDTGDDDIRIGMM